MSIRDEILALKSKDGLFRVETILGWAAKHPKSDLHAAIEWDNQKAADAWRSNQVRSLIRLHVLDVDGYPQLVSLSIDRVQPGGGYRDRAEILEVQALSEIMLADALAELIRVRQKYIHISKLAGVWAAVDDLEKEQQRRKSGGPTGQPPKHGAQPAPSKRRAKQA